MTKYTIRRVAGAVLIAGVSACNPGGFGKDEARVGTQSAQAVSPKPDAPAAPVDIGKPLFEETEFAAPAAKSATITADPVVVPQCVVNNFYKQDVSTEVEGVIKWIGRELKPGEAKPDDPFDLVEMADPYKPAEKKWYVRLKLNAPVEKDQTVVILDTDLALTEFASAAKAVISAQKELEANQKSAEFYKLDWERSKGLGSSIPKADQERSAAQYFYAEATSAAKDAAVEKATYDKARAEKKVVKHIIPTAISGRVVALNKQVGESVRPGETIMQIQDMTRLKVEGFVETQKKTALKLGQEVVLHPVVKVAPFQTLPLITSNKPISGLAVTSFEGKPLILSASEDGHVVAWNRAEIVTRYKHPDAVRAIACTLPTVEKPFAITGCDDGKARLWWIGAEKKDPVVFDGHHTGGVQAVAVSPDGKFCVTSDDREIYMWDVAKGKKLYTFAHEHVQPVVRLVFTPQGRVVSVGKENDSIVVWRVGDKGANVERTFPNRTGDVPAVGVTDDGNKLLLDLDQSRLSVVNLSDGATESNLQLPGEGSKFAGIALFSPKLDAAGQRIVATSGRGEGALQIWRMPAGNGRGAELADLACPDGAAVSTAAFSPDAKEGFLVVGTKRGAVYLWKLPEAADLAHQYKAKIAYISGADESNGKTIKFFAEFINPADERRQLRPGTGATLVIER